MHFHTESTFSHEVLKVTTLSTMELNESLLVLSGLIILDGMSIFNHFTLFPFAVMHTFSSTAHDQQLVYHKQSCDHLLVSVHYQQHRWDSSEQPFHIHI